MVCYFLVPWLATHECVKAKTLVETMAYAITAMVDQVTCQTMIKIFRLLSYWFGYWFISEVISVFYTIACMRNQLS